MVAAMSPEFNVMGTVNITGNSRNKTEDPFANKEPESYRAVVHIFMAGGMDSFNLLVPQGCDLWTQYNTIRGDIALATGDLLVVTEGNAHRREIRLRGNRADRIRLLPIPSHRHRCTTTQLLEWRRRRVRRRGPRRRRAGTSYAGTVASC